MFLSLTPKILLKPKSINKRQFIYSKKYKYSIEKSSKDILITENAVKKLRSIRKSEKNDNLKLRVAIDSGGCNGFSVQFSLDDKAPKKDDVLIEKDGEFIVIDEISLDLVRGSKLDYIEEIAKSSFALVDIPNADSSCGCHSSFGLKF